MSYGRIESRREVLGWDGVNWGGLGWGVEWKRIGLSEIQWFGVVLRVWEVEQSGD